MFLTFFQFREGTIPLSLLRGRFLPPCGGRIPPSSDHFSVKFCMVLKGTIAIPPASVWYKGACLLCTRHETRILCKSVHLLCPPPLLLSKHMSGCPSTASSRKRRCTHFAVGDFVCGLPGDREGVVVQRDAERTVVVGWANIVASYPSANLVQSTWRDNVQEGDVVEFLSGSTWHPALVRGVQSPTESVAVAHAHCGEVLVVEPAFLGFTLSFPLRSLRLRQLSENNSRVRSLLDSGFAFDHKLDSDGHRSWPAYHPNGCLHTRAHAPKYMALSDYEKYNPDTTTHAPGTSQRCWAVGAPCRLPGDVRMVAVDSVRNHHTLFVHNLDLYTTAETRMKKPLEAVTKHRLGTHTVPLKDVLPLNTLTSLLAAEVHVRNGDSALSARKLFYENMHAFVSKSERATDLVKSLLFYACSLDHGRHLYSCTTPVWGHKFGSTTASPATLRQSLSQVSVLTDYEEEVCELHQRACIWSNYEREWRHARWVQRCAENVLPLEIFVSDMSVANRSVTFDVTLVLGRAHSDSYAYTEHWLRHGATVLSAFSSPPPNLGCFNPCDWDNEMLRVCGHEGAKRLAETAFLRVSRASWLKPPLSSFLERSLTTADGHRVSWNVCEGAGTHGEEAVQFTHSTLSRPRGGGVLVLPCDFDAHIAVKHMVDMHQRDTRPWRVQRLPSHPPQRKSPCLVLTSPTKLFEWQRMFAEAGLDSVVYHGCGRRGPATTEVLARGGVLIATYRAMCEFYDMFFLNSVLPGGFSHVFVDEFDVSNPATCLVDGLMQVHTTNMWMLAKKATRDIVAFALPVLRVEPFYSRSQWHTDGLTNYRFRAHAHAFVVDAGRGALEAFEVKRALHMVASRIVFCLREDTKSRLCVVHCHHRVGETLSMQHRLLLKAVVETMMQRRHFSTHGGTWNQSLFQMQNTWQHLSNAAWGVRPPVHVCGDRTPWHQCEVSVNADAHAEIMLRDAGDSQMVRDAAIMVTSAAAGMGVEAECPICFEPLSKRKFGLVGQCGHSVCCQCFANMRRAAVARVAASVVPTNPEVSCPMCRQAWWGSTVHARPLLMPCGVDARVGIDTRPGKDSGVYLVPRVIGTTEWVHKNPMLGTLERLVARLRANRAKVFGEPPKRGRGKIVVVTHSNNLCNHLWSHFEDFDTPTTLCVRINGCVSVQNRGVFLISFQSKDGNFDLLFITIKMLRGLVFERAQHWIVCEKLTREDAGTLERSVLASARAFAGRQTVHTLDAPQSRRLMHLVEHKQQWLDKTFADPWREADVWKTWSAMESKRAPPQTAAQSTTNFPCTGNRLRQLVARQESEGEYISLFRRFLGIHTALGSPNELERSVARELAEKGAPEPHPSEINPEWEPPTIDLTGDAVVAVSV